MASRGFGHPVSSLASIPAVAIASLLAAPAPAGEALSITHQPVHCVVAGRYPQLDACFEPSPRVARARVYFKGEGGPEWYYVEMKPEAACYRGTLPRPKKSLKRILYYVAVTDQDFAESRSEEYTADVVGDAKSCTIGAAAPYVTTASVLVSGAAALPAGFAGAGILAGVGTTTLATAAVVGAGTAGAVIAGGGEEPITITRPPRPTTTTTTGPSGPTSTTTTTPTTTTTTTTTLPSGCASDSGPPDVAFVSPQDNDDVGAAVSIVVEAGDPGPVANGIREVTISADEQGGSRTAAIATLPGPGPTFPATWAVPPCEGPGDRWYIEAAAVDGCNNTTSKRVMVRRRSSNCQGSAAAPTSGGDAPVPSSGGAPAPASGGGAPALVWSSELAVAGGRGQVIANGGDVLFPGPGRSELTVPARAGRNSVEAVLVESEGPGTWRFTLASGAIHPGSLRVVAGEVVAAGPETVAFRLRGRSGERAVFAFEVDR